MIRYDLVYHDGVYQAVIETTKGSRFVPLELIRLNVGAGFTPSKKTPVVIPTQEELDKVIDTLKVDLQSIVDNSIAEAHKKIVGVATYDSLGEIDAAITAFNQTGTIDLVRPGDALETPWPGTDAIEAGDIIFFFIKDDGLEEAVIDTSGELRRFTKNTELNEIIIGIEEDLAALIEEDEKFDQRIVALEDANANVNLTIENLKDLTGNIDIPTSIPETDTKAATRGGVRQVEERTKQLIDAASAVSLALANRIASLENANDPNEVISGKLVLIQDFAMLIAPNRLTASIDLTGLKTTNNVLFNQAAGQNMKVWFQIADNVYGNRTISVDLKAEAITGSRTETITLFNETDSGDADLSNVAVWKINWRGSHIYIEGNLTETTAIKIVEFEQDLAITGVAKESDLALISKRLTDAIVKFQGKTDNAIQRRGIFNTNSVVAVINQLIAETIRLDSAKQDKLTQAQLDVINNPVASVNWKDNANLLLTTDTDAANPLVAVGKGYAGAQTYAQNATGAVLFATAAKNIVSIASSTTGAVSLSQNATGTTTISSAASGSLDIGSNVWAANDGKGKLIHGNKSATFEQIIDKAKEAAGTGTAPTWKRWNNATLFPDYTKQYRFRNSATDTVYVGRVSPGTLTSPQIKSVTWEWTINERSQIKLYVNNSSTASSSATINTTTYIEVLE